MKKRKDVIWYNNLNLANNQANLANIATWYTN